MQSAVVPPRRNQDALAAAPPQVQVADVKQVQVPVVRIASAQAGAPCGIAVAPSFAPTRAGVPPAEQAPSVQVPLLTGTHSSGAVSPPVPLASHGHSSVLSVGSISLSSMPTAAWPSLLPGQAPTRGRTNVVTRQGSQVISRYSSGAGPPGSKPCSVATPSRGSALSVAEAGETRWAVIGTAESREASQQPTSQCVPPASPGADADKSARKPSKGTVATPKKEPASVRVPRSPSPRRDEDVAGSAVRRSASQVDLRSDAKKRTQPLPKTNASGPEEASMLRLLQRDVEELRQENSRLQEKLCKSRSLVLLLQKQADEARAEKEKEHRRAEGLQTQLQQLNKQLRKEIARGQQMERTMSAAGHRVWPRSEPAHRQEEDSTGATPVKQRGVSPSRNGNSVSAPPFSYDLAPMVKDDLYDSLHDTSLPAIEAASMDNSLEANADCPGQDVTRADKVLVSDEKGPEAVPARITKNLMAAQLGGEGTERSWEFVVQGQHEAIDQEDFAAKLVSCFPDNAVEKAWSSGVAFVCTRGRRMDTTVPNQDDFLVARHTLSDEGYIALYGIFDGHGPNGHLCAAFARGSLPESIFGQHTLLMKPEDTLREAFRHTQSALAEQPFDTQHSGTTAALALVLNVPSSNLSAADRDKDQSETWLFVAHVGDSRIILASHREDEPSAFSVTALTRDHRPDDAAEAERVQNDGGEVRKLHRNAGNVRVFAPGQERPGLALTRSLGDFAAADCGVIAEPEVAVYKLRSGIDALLMLGTDGLFEFCSNTDAASKLLKEGVTAAGLESLCAESRRQWAASSYNETVDDITAVVATLPTSPSMTPA